MRQFHKAIWLIGLPVVHACGPGVDSQRDNQWNARVDTLGDTVIVQTVSGSVWGVPRDLQAGVRVGTVDGPEPYLLGNIIALGVSPLGDIYALDSQAALLRVYSPTGEHIRNIGSRGSGPGELSRPNGFALLPDGRIAVHDPGNARISIYDVDGDLIDSWPHSPASTGVSRRAVYSDTLGFLYVLAVLDRTVDVASWQFGLTRIDQQGRVLDTIPTPVWPYDRPTVVAREGNRTSMYPVPFSPQVSWAFSPLGYFVGGLSTRYRLDLFRTRQPVVRIEKLDHDPPAVVAAEKAEAEERVTTQLRRILPGWRWNGPPIPDRKPPFRNVYVADDGRVWVLLSQRAQHVEDADQISAHSPGFVEPTVFDVFEADGTYLGRAVAPRELAVYPDPVFRGDTVWAVSQDDLGVPYITRYHVPRGGIDPGPR